MQPLDLPCSTPALTPVERDKRIIRAQTTLGLFANS
jgi:hypothetical protein